MSKITKFIANNKLPTVFGVFALVLDVIIWSFAFKECIENTAACYEDTFPMGMYLLHLPLSMIPMGIYQDLLGGFSGGSIPAYWTMIILTMLLGFVQYFTFGFLWGMFVRSAIRTFLPLK